ncbi:putative glutamine synthetase [Lobosporangium transversale]|uniref:Glutamine synthetase n=1 Tax=Lobosporangium transversale TaxID=64571 RepID=A0A1Y2GQ34_9FUNG|nr:putative glutamine synthetase [Lobosporangium transversale]ORZ18409.1 putative glutamine synthetase [Lobosporangium transversale]|eukprot:XP_021882204.1 putative glutamine synthetase [Lobosporangium transversale]
MSQDPNQMSKTEVFTKLLMKDHRVKIAGIDLDGIFRGKIMAKSKFLSVLESGFGFCSVIFGWDMHDQTYPEELSVSNAANGYRDIIAVPDLSTFRRIPWENNIPFFLLSFLDPATNEPLAVCPRSVLKRVTDELASMGWEAMCGAEFEFFNFKESPEALEAKGHTKPKKLTPGMFGYSLLRPSLNQEYFYDIFDECKKFDINIESLHTETGPGVFEAALSYDTAVRMADMASLFKLSAKQLGIKHGIMPTFMAKPYTDQPGCSGHLHFSLRDIASRTNLFAAGLNSDSEEEKGAAASTEGQDRPEWEKTVEGVQYMSQVMKWFVAGLLTGLPSIMAILAPNINSYKRLVENYWAPVTVSWGIESRVSAIRVIGPPQCDPKGTRLEMRVGGADINPHLAIAACLAMGLYGIKNKLPLPVGPTTTTATTQNSGTNANAKNERLPKSLKESAEAMLAPDSLARKVLGDAFVDHYGATRLNEYRIWETSVTTWETKRYFELV